MLHRRTKEIRTDIEKKIITGMIISTEYLQKVFNLVNLKYFALDYSKIVAKWTLDYFKKYKEAPYHHIQDIYNVEKANLKETQAELIESFLYSLSSQFERESKFNVDYLIDRTIEYFEERSLMLLAEDIQAYVGAGKIQKAKEILQNHKAVAKTISQWINPFDEQFVSDVYRSYLSLEQDDISENLFKFPGKLGSLMGTFKRGWLISYLAPRKRGKTFFLQETAIQAATNKLNVAIFSLEMSKLGFSGRILQRIASIGNESVYYFPVFDCLRNQDGTCARRESTKIVYVNGEVMDYDEGIGHVVCTKCRGEPNFIPSTWFEKIQRPVMAEKRLKRSARGFVFSYGDRIRIKVYPAYSANLSDIMADLDLLEYAEGFVPDVIVIDYADILAPEDRRADLNTRIDETWKMMKQLAEKRHCAVFTATQGNRRSGESKNVKANDVSWDIRKNDHVDAQYTLSQTADEKRRGVLRVANSLHRWQEFDENKQVIVLQNLKLAQVILDCE